MLIKHINFSTMNFDIEILIRFLLSLLWGGLVGAEREYRGKAAGFRTTIMISFGACFFTLMSNAIGGPGNPDRIASNVVTGIGFLGAGVIFRGNDRVNGITTAATIWTVAAVGMGIGGGYYFAAGCASFLILFILGVLPMMQRRIDSLNQPKTLYVRFDRSVNGAEICESAMAAAGIRYRLTKQVKDGQKLHLTWQLSGKAPAMASFFKDVYSNEELDFIES